MNVNEIIAEVRKNEGVEFVENVKIEGVKVASVISDETGEPYFRVTMTTDKPIAAMRDNGNGVYEKGETNVVTDIFSNMIGAIRGNDDYKKIINHINEHPKSLEILLAGAKMDVLCVPVKAKEVYKNPFSKSDSEGRIVKNDTIYHHVTNVKPSAANVADINKVIANLLGLF